jgi:hypothetical protein
MQVVRRTEYALRDHFARILTVEALRTELKRAAH